MNPLQQFSNALTEATSAAAAYVVGIKGGTRFGASGVVWQPGVAVTTRSTLRREDGIRVTLPSGAAVPATLAGHDPGTDLAVLRFEGESAARGALAGSVLPGQLVLAIGRAENTGPNAALGLISAVGKPWQTWQGGKLDAYIRLDLQIAPGTSGAAVVDTDGALIGIASGALSRIAALAIPAATIDRVATQLLERGSVSKPWLGVAVQPVPLPSTLAEAANSVSHGLVVLAAEPETPAGKAGIMVGDILLAIHGATVREPMDLRGLLAQYSGGETVTVTLLRGGERREIAVTLGEKAVRR